MTEGQVRDLLRQIACPVLAVYAEPAQPYFPEPLRSERAALPPDLRLVRLQGGHHVHMDQPRMVAADVVPFLGGTLRG
jgi:pimeloyl-ACP methyl ester carboxylesterase